MRTRGEQTLPDSCPHIGACSCFILLDRPRAHGLAYLTDDPRFSLVSPAFLLLDPAAETWPSGRRHTPAKGAGGKPPRGFESLRLRHIQLPNPSKGPDWGLFSFCFKGRWLGDPPSGDWALDAEWVSELPVSLFERLLMVTGRRETSSHFQWVAAFMGSPRSRNIPVTETDTKAQGGQKAGSVAADPEVRRQRSKRARTLPEVSDDKQTSRP